jgi:hypothetical protein
MATRRKRCCAWRKRSTLAIDPNVRYWPIDGLIGRRACGYLKIEGAALQADGETRSPVTGLKHQKEKRSMEHFAGLDVSVKETSICIVDDTGKIVREVKVASEPDERQRGTESGIGAQTSRSVCA